MLGKNYDERTAKDSKSTGFLLFERGLDGRLYNVATSTAEDGGIFSSRGANTNDHRSIGT
jgi:hypothetical protein